MVRSMRRRIDLAEARARERFGSRARPGAIITITSRFAIGVIKAARAFGINMPDDMMVATLSESELARSQDIPVTGVDLHGDVVGREGVALLLQRLAKSAAPAPPLIVSPTLRLRASTADPV